MLVGVAVVVIQITAGLVALAAVALVVIQQMVLELLEQLILAVAVVGALEVQHPAE
jgi:hypothetical protein